MNTDKPVITEPTEQESQSVDSSRINSSPAVSSSTNVLPTNISIIETNLKNKQYKFGLFSLLRYLESYQIIQPDLFGKSLSPKYEKVRIRQDPNLSFPVSEIESIKLKDGKIAITINNYGLLSINSPLPSFLLEYIFQRQHHHSDRTWTAFVNMLQHRLTTLFYRGWASSQSVLFLENPKNNRFNSYILSLAGMANLPLGGENNHIAEYSKLYFLGFLLQPRSSYNLTKLLSQYFKVPISIQENVGEWVEVPKSEQTQLGSSQYTLGDGLLLGSKIYDQSSKIRITVGPLSLKGYTSFFKGYTNHLRMSEWVDLYLGKEYKWDILPLLRKEEIPEFRMGQTQLGLNSWLGHPNKDGDNVIISNN